MVKNSWLKEYVLKLVYNALQDGRYDDVESMYQNCATSGFAEAILERIYDYARLQSLNYVQFDKIKQLLADLDSPIEEYWVDVLFYRAVLGKDIDKMRYFYGVGANIHAWNDVAIRLAFEINDYELAKVLIDMGADVSANGGQALKASVKNQDLKMTALIAEALIRSKNVSNFLQ